MDLKSLNKSRKEEEFTDFTILAEGVGFPVHRVLLHQRSEYFKTLFKTKMKKKTEQRSEQKDVTAIAVERVLDAIYGEDLVIDVVTVTDVLKVCHLWMLENEVKACKDFLLEHITMDTCISTRNLATLYSMEDLGTKCDEFIITHLKEVTDRSELTELGVTAVCTILPECVNEEVLSCHLWDFYLKWSESRKESGKSVLCEAMKSFPAKKFDVVMIRCVAWPNPHIQNCAICRGNVGKKLFSVVDKENFSQTFSQSALSIPGDSDVMDNCLFIKQMAKLFANEPIEVMADDFILKNYRLAFACKGFVDIDEEDLLAYASRISKSCSMWEFSTLMQWLRKSPNREGTFLRLFGDKTEIEDSPFLYSLRKLKGFQLLNNHDCFYVQRLAEKYGCNAFQDAIDSYISWNFEEVSGYSEFAGISLDKMKKYVQSSSMRSITSTRSREERFCTLWRGVHVWRNGNLDLKDDGSFEELLSLLPFDEASLIFIKNTVLPGLLTQKTKDHVMNTVLYRAIQMEKESKRR